MNIAMLNNVRFYLQDGSLYLPDVLHAIYKDLQWKQ